MLRWLIAALVAANLVYFAGTRGYLVSLGWPDPAAQHEPRRLAQQIQPERLRLLNGPRGSEPEPDGEPTSQTKSTPPATGAAAATSAGTPSPAPSELTVGASPVPTNSPPAAPEPATTAAPVVTAPAPPAPTTCWQASGFGSDQAELLRAELRLLGLPDGGWQLSEARSPGRWIVYMGRYDNNDQAARKKAELRELGIDFRDVNTQGLAPGLALGTFSSEEAADEGLQQVTRRGVRTARVVQERAESVSFNLRLPAITEAQRLRIESLGPAMAGRSLQRCS
ncbi:MAG: SPOR domain-containing protein [Hydrogenophaga sp.]|uniref:SPOR domain-containing protein n=1 Tax=Hydrogenophaga sp. TaxID=1904254 RepID=UPI001D7BA834|nr:SPOR domain-containing protein [Hydrogenophaga sp.]MBX3608460.1 SPOR domain-containing protein [Hydrogenophaga sp.]